MAHLVEKAFSTTYRLLRKFLNFVFLRTLLYDGTACSQKTKNAKNAVGSIPTAFLKPHRQHFVLPPPLTFKWRHNSVDYILACFRSFIDSLSFLIILSASSRWKILLSLRESLQPIQQLNQNCLYRYKDKRISFYILCRIHQ